MGFSHFFTFFKGFDSCFFFSRLRLEYVQEKRVLKELHFRLFLVDTGSSFLLEADFLADSSELNLNLQRRRWERRRNEVAAEDSRLKETLPGSTILTRVTLNQRCRQQETGRGKKKKRSATAARPHRTRVSTRATHNNDHNKNNR